MSEADWLIETQCRHVAREMRQARDKAERGVIFDQWQQIFPNVTRQRVAQIWREGVPMPSNQKGVA